MSSTGLNSPTSLSRNTQKALMRLSYLNVSSDALTLLQAGEVLPFEVMFFSMFDNKKNWVEPHFSFARRLAPVLGEHPEMLRLQCIAQHTDPRGGFSALALVDSGGEKAIAFRGSNRPLDFIDDWQMSIHENNRQKLEAIDFFERYCGEVEANRAAPVHLIGHSLGGGLATFLFILLADERPDVEAFVVNSAYFPDPDTDGLVARLADSRFMSYSDENDGLYTLYKMLSTGAETPHRDRIFEAVSNTPAEKVAARLLQRKESFGSQWKFILDVYERYLRKEITNNVESNIFKGHSLIDVEL